MSDEQSINLGDQVKVKVGINSTIDKGGPQSHPKPTAGPTRR